MFRKEISRTLSNKDCWVEMAFKRLNDDEI